MIVYLDSSVLVRAYLPDETGHIEARSLLLSNELTLVTGTWTRIEATGALVRAGRSGRADVAALLGALREDLGPDGPVTVLAAPQAAVETVALSLVVQYGLRAMDAWHLATAQLVTQELLEPGEAVGFASRDASQAAVAEALEMVWF